MDRVGTRATSRAGWLAALVAVPALLAGIALLWPGPEMAADLRQRSEAALDAAGISGVAVAVSGRDAELDGVPRGSETQAMAAVAAVDGVRDARVGVVTDAPSGPSTPAGTAPPGSPELPPEQRAELADTLAALTAAAPVTFAGDSADLVGPAAATVRQAADALMRRPGARVELVGYCADTPGSPQVAQQLSERRAVAVADALVAAGVDRARITTVGRGDAEPLDTPAASRRVEIHVS